GVARYNADGSHDTSFGSGGIVTTEILRGLGNIRNANAMAVAIQPDGKILVAGSADKAATGSSNQDFVLARYNTDGSLDVSFGSGGYVVTDLLGTNGDDVPASILLQPVAGGFRILVVGSRANHSTHVRDFAIAA